MAKKNKIEDAEFTPLSEFKEAARKILSVSKEESDKQIADYQAELKEKRETRAKKTKCHTR